MGRPHLSEAQQREIGQQVSLARGAGVSWKVLTRVYGRSKVQLWRYILVFESNETH